MVARKPRQVPRDDGARLPNLSRRFFRDNRIDAGRLIDEILRKTGTDGLLMPDEVRKILAAALAGSANAAADDPLPIPD
ncbi:MULTISPECIES: hypothetical protein [unclassified Mesorhizobium]|uniref:hypothetical protein n=1 Tax=unclassified Mesorhizobium TaxID=325217 RepID=UPI0024175362|nr:MULTISPECIES: hypothetical protein [unclassified Mesorhizobium]WFP61752.1 hypothetical protein QAZ47_25250 [Mesorhizobium sp. WSM4904]WFP75029.1 hypothetical protein QAZ22_25390 [Mesorhizobium sp. WSM4906]